MRGLGYTLICSSPFVKVGSAVDEKSHDALEFD